MRQLRLTETEETLWDWMEANNTRRFRRDKIARDARIPIWVAKHPDSGETVETLTAKIELAAD